jgi:uncharacterized membrane protein
MAHLMNNKLIGKFLTIVGLTLFIFGILSFILHFFGDSSLVIAVIGVFLLPIGLSLWSDSYVSMPH